MKLFKRINNWLSELSGAWLALIFVIALSIASWGINEFFGKKYTKLYPNKQSYSWAITQFKMICGNCSPEETDGGLEYSKFYDSRGQAINDFMALARSLDGKYANGKFKHLYVPRKERIYQCYDKNRKLIAIRCVRHKGGFFFGSWEKSFYEIQFYVED